MKSDSFSGSFSGAPSGGPSGLGPVRGLPLVLILLLGANIIPELALQAADRNLIPFAGLRAWCFALGSFQPDLNTVTGPLFGLQPVTMFFTYGFLHTGLSHLLINMLGLIWLGRIILSYRTTETFVLFYLIAMVGAAQVFLLTDAGTGTVVGASGALFGLFGVYAIDAGFFASSKPRQEEAAIQFFRLSVATWGVALADLASQSMLGSTAAWQAHAGGFLTGAVCALLLPPRFRMPQNVR